MGISAEVAYAAARKYTLETILGAGAVAGKNCTIDSITDITGGKRVTFKWTLDDDSVQTRTMDVMNGAERGSEDFSAYEDAVNVKDYGAVGDGVADDSEAFITALGTNHSVILIPQGSYNLANTAMNLTAAVTFVGENCDVTEIIDANITAPLGITVKGVMFNGGTKRVITDNGYPSGINDSKVTIYATPSGTEGSVIYERCAFKNTDVASVAFTGTLVESNIIDCVFEDITYCGVFHCSNIGSAKATGNVFRNIGNTTVPESASKSIKIFPLCLGDYSNGTNREVKSCLIENNLFDTLVSAVDTNTNHSHWYNANFVAVVCEQALIRNNVFKNLMGYGDDRESIYTKGNNVEICDNLIINGGAGEGYICSKYKLNTTSPARAMLIHDNILIGEFGNGIRVYGTAYIYNNSISIDKIHMGIRANAIVDGLRSIHVTNNHFYCGAAPLTINGTSITTYKPDNLITFGGSYLRGITVKDNSISITQAEGYNKYVGYLIKVNDVVSDITITGNTSNGTVSNNAISLSDNDSALSNPKKITIDIEDNVFDTQNSGGIYCNITQNPSLIKKYVILNNFIKSVTSGANGTQVTSVSNNDDVIYFEDNQAEDAFTPRRHLYTSAKYVYTSLPSNYISLASGATTKIAPRELPAPPATNGTYTLRATVTNNAVTYSWV